MTRLPLLPRLPWMRRLAFVFPVLLFFGCRDAELPTAPPSDGPAFDHSVGVNGGNGHFFFLAPLVPAPTYSGSFDGSLAPVVRICEWSTAGCGRTVAEFSKTSGTGSEVVRVDATAEQYLVNWQTDRCAWGACTLDPAKTYRLRVLVAGVELGFADLQVAKSGREVRNLTTGTTVKLVNGRSLPVKFRIELGAISVLSAGEAAPIGSEGGTVALADGSAVLAFPMGALTNSTPISVTPVSPGPATAGAVSGTVYDFGPDGTQFATPVLLAVRYPAALPAGVAEGQLRLYHHLGSQWELVQGSRVDPSTKMVNGAISHFSAYGVLEAVYSVAVTPSETTLSAGTTAQLSVELRDSTGQVLTDRIVTWTSSDSSVFVNDTGLIYAGTSGTALIIATSEGVSDTVQVTVTSQQSGMQIAFVTDNGISLVNADGTGRTSLATGFDQYSSQPSWSPDGGELVFQARVPGEGYASIYAMRHDGSDRRTLAGDVHVIASGPVWAPYGEHIAYETAPPYSQGQVIVMAPDGSQLTNIRVGGAGASYLPAFPAREDMIALFSDRKLYLVHPRDGSMATHLGDKVYHGDTDRPSWSPDGRQIVFVAADPADNLHGIYIINADGSNQRVIFPGVFVDGSVYMPKHPQWSPDGRQIAFEFRGEIYIVFTDGSGLRTLAAGVRPEWSPDGNYIAFGRNGDIYVMGADGSSQTNVTNTPTVQESLPAWRRWQE